MDKLKENLFAIGVGATVVVLGVLVYFLVYSPLAELSAAEDRLDKSVTRIARLTKSEYVPNEKYVRYLEGKKAANVSDIEDAVRFYDERMGRFGLFFDDSPKPPPPSIFNARIKDSVDALVESYREKFGIEGEDGSTDGLPPTVDVLSAAMNSETMQKAMKEYWIVEEVMNACSSLDIGGLQSIAFEGRGRSKVSPYPYHRLIDVQVSVRVPFSKLEDLITLLFASDRVLFQIQDLAMAKDGADLEEATGFVQERSYPNRSAADSAEQSYDALFPEPATPVRMTLQAVDWTGIPTEETTTEET